MVLRHNLILHRVRVAQAQRWLVQFIRRHDLPPQPQSGAVLSAANGYDAVKEVLLTIESMALSLSVASVTMISTVLRQGTDR